MTRRAPEDPAFNRMVREQIESGLNADEKLLFITPDNQIAEAIYPTEFGSGEPARVRDRLEQAGRLKAVVHVSATHIGNKVHAPRISLVEYLPEDRIYQFRYAPSWGAWEQPELEEITQSYKELWREENS
jgi:hypothetical protein